MSYAPYADFSKCLRKVTDPKEKRPGEKGKMIGKNGILRQRGIDWKCANHTLYREDRLPHRPLKNSDLEWSRIVERFVEWCWKNVLEISRTPMPKIPQIKTATSAIPKNQERRHYRVSRLPTSLSKGAYLHHPRFAETLPCYEMCKTFT